MVTHIKESIKMEKHMEREHILGKMERRMMVSGLEAKNADMEFGEAFMVIAILANG